MFVPNNLAAPMMDVLVIPFDMEAVPPWQTPGQFTEQSAPGNYRAKVRVRPVNFHKRQKKIKKQKRRKCKNRGDGPQRYEVMPSDRNGLGEYVQEPAGRSMGLVVHGLRPCLFARTLAGQPAIAQP